MSNSQKTTDRDGKSTSNGVWKDREICFWVHYKKKHCHRGEKKHGGILFCEYPRLAQSQWMRQRRNNFEFLTWGPGLIYFFSRFALCISDFFYFQLFPTEWKVTCTFFFCVCVCVCVLLLPINWAFFCLSQCLLASFTGRGNATLPPISVALETRLIISADYMAYLQATWKKNAKLCKNKPFFGYKKACFA